MKRYEQLMEEWSPDNEVKTANVNEPSGCDDMSQDNTECEEDVRLDKKKKAYPATGTIL